MLTSKTPIFFRPGDIRRARRRAPDRPITRWVALGILVAAMVFCGGFVVGISHAETVVYCTAQDALNCRWQPSRQSDVLYRLYPGDSAVATEISDGWVKLVIGGDECWASADYLSETAPEELPGSVTVTGGRLSLRSSPEGRRRGWLKKGQAVRPLGVMGEWCRVETGGSTGWVLRHYLEGLK